MVKEKREIDGRIGREADPGRCGQLFVCGTPIGNLEDVTLRLLRTLREVSVIAAEDTRHTRKLLNHYDIDTPLISLHEHNEQTRISDVLRRLEAGESVALVSDAGMPAISDPGAQLIAAVAEADIDIVVVPGPTAFVTALVGSGLAHDRFAFEGFLPRHARRRKERLKELSTDTRTLVFYEAPHRLARTLRDMLEGLGDRPACVARELTKAFEQWQRATLAELAAYWEAETPRGEFVIVVAGAAEQTRDKEGRTADSAEREEPSEEQLADAVRQRMATGLDKKTAIKAVAEDVGLPRRVVYRAAVHIDAQTGESDE